MEEKSVCTYEFPSVSRLLEDAGVPTRGRTRHTRSASLQVTGANLPKSSLAQGSGKSTANTHKRCSRTMSHEEITSSRSGHSRTGSRTDFILPPGHADRPKTRGHARNRYPSITGENRGHTREASRTESLYTLRQHTVSLLERLRFWKTKDDVFTHQYRTVVPNHTVPSDTSQHPNRAYMGNEVQTTKYTLLSFLPKNLLEQFHRFANFYFLFIVVLNWVPQINAFGKEISMVPLLFVLSVTAIKDIFEDRRRYNSDKRVNNSTCRVYSA